jgi:tripeptidyl-peptidase I
MLSLLASVVGGVTIYGELEGNGWTRHPTALAASAPISLTISLRQQNVDSLKRAALAVSTPGNPEYGKFLTAEEVATLTAPKDVHVQTVGAWLNQHSITYKRSREVLHVSTTVSAASALLDTWFATFSDSNGRSIVRAATSYSLPTEVDEAISTIFGLHGLPLPLAPTLAVPGTPAKVTPAVIASTYTMGTPFVNRSGANRQAVAEFQGQVMPGTCPATPLATAHHLLTTAHHSAWTKTT